MKIKNKSEQHSAVRSTRIIIVIYLLLKLPLFMFAENPAKWAPRIVACAVMLALVYFVTSLKLSNRATAILASLSISLPEIIWCAAFQKGEWLIFIFLIGCSLVCLLYLDSIGLLIYMTLSCSAMSICSFGLGIVMSGEGMTVWNDVYGFSGLMIVDLLIFFICQYSVGAFARFNNTGKTFNRILETTPSHMVVINEKAIIEHISVSFAEWLGVSRWEYALNRPLLDFCHTGEMTLMFQEIMESGENIVKDYNLTINGETYWLLVRSFLMGGKVARIFEITDITPIMQAKNEAEAATRAKSDFLANMSHEIRTPMNAIVGMTELIMLKPLEQEQLSYAVSIKGAAMSLLKIINDILDFSKIDAQKMEIINKPFDFVSLINDTINMINIKVESAGIAFTTNISKDIPPLINSDEIRIKQVLINILNNAVKFTSKGCVSLTVYSEVMEGGSLKLNFIVRDTGMGIKKEDMGKLFGEFQQLDTHKNRNIVGTGLGLAITRRLIELMGGAISVESVYGKGTAFSFYIVCQGEHKGSLVSLRDPEQYKVVFYEPDTYRAQALNLMLESLNVECVSGGTLTDFQKNLEYAGYTHVFFDKAAIDIISGLGNPEGTSFILMKDIDDTRSYSLATNVVNRPVLITNLVHMLKGHIDNEAVLYSSEEVKLGAFKTKDVRVLLVDDNPVNLMVAEGMLRQYGIGVVTAQGGKESIEAIQKESFDIVFMDHMMPDVDGIDAARAIRALGGGYCDIPIIALSANAISGVEELFFEAGMNDFLSKPIVVMKLHQVLLKYIPSEKII